MRPLKVYLFLVVPCIPSWGLAPQVGHARRTFRYMARPLSRESNDAPPSPSNESLLREEALSLLQKAQALRRQIPNHDQQDVLAAIAPARSKWNVPFNASSSANDVGYRLYVDIGREEGTWMDPRWGASQRRIEFTLDVAFVERALDERDARASRDLVARMVPDNFGGSRSPVYRMNVAPAARLRSGFAEMACHSEGAYRLDTNRGAMASSTVRFLISTQGTEEDKTYGDIYVPKGDLYFSLPAFGSGVQQLSRKDGVVSVRQIGWNTGWRRLESRIVGTFRAVPIEEAQQQDGF
jgi:hypothetical protein